MQEDTSQLEQTVTVRSGTSYTHALTQASGPTVTSESVM